MLFDHGRAKDLPDADVLRARGQILARSLVNNSSCDRGEMRRTRIYLAGVVALITIIGSTTALANTARSTAGMVVTVQPLATDAGVDAMRKGGNAIDAAVAAALTLGVVDGHNSGIGGGCFVLIRTAKGEFVAIDGRETAPAAAT